MSTVTSGATNGTDDIVDWPAFTRARALLGADFVRILGYFREDGEKSIAAIEEAMRKGSAAALVLPAHTLKGDSLQVGATLLGTLAEHVEMTARRCVEAHDAPDELIADVVRLRPLFRETIALFDRDTAPAAPRRVPGSFGRKAAAGTR